MVDTQSGNHLKTSDGDIKSLTTQLVNHVDQMDQASLNVNELYHQLQTTMISSAGQSFGQGMTEWNTAYKNIKDKLMGVIDKLEGARKQFDTAEQDNQQIATKWAGNAYGVLSGHGSGSGH
ncbi:WXG100 family type VII secretion target [Saccharopolyspora shandongensis]|uniref:WXG100 family type VII secretion target n=1 Tax=Saccharopolyspora shandongensis TaxID=418495 RepID=UPI00340A5305